MTIDPSHLVLIALAALAGAVVGSFLTTAAMRLARGEAWARGRSHCDECGAVLGYRQTAPIVSYVCSGGRCTHCSAPISWLHPVGEAAGALIAVGAALAPSPPSMVILLVLGSCLLFLTVFDALTLTIPDALSAGVALICAFAALRSGEVLAGVATAAATLSVLLSLNWAFVKFKGRPGLGGGDIKLLAALALWLGAEGLPVAVAIAAFLALAAIGVARLSNRAVPVKTAFGPFIGAGAWVSAMVMHRPC